MKKSYELQTAAKIRQYDEERALNQATQEAKSAAVKDEISNVVMQMIKKKGKKRG